MEKIMTEISLQLFEGIYSKILLSIWKVYEIAATKAVILIIIISVFKKVSKFA